MKKTVRKLTIHRETIRTLRALSQAELAGAGGGDDVLSSVSKRECPAQALVISGSECLAK